MKIQLFFYCWNFYWATIYLKHADFARKICMLKIGDRLKGVNYVTLIRAIIGIWEDFGNVELLVSLVLCFLHFGELLSKRENWKKNPRVCLDNIS